jgi:hypothetical protein
MLLSFMVAPLCSRARLPLAAAIAALTCCARNDRLDARAGASNECAFVKTLGVSVT